MENGVITITWDVKDVMQICPSLSRSESESVLQFVEDNHDGNEGVTWNVIKSAARELFPDRIDLERE
jgi:hypothetical protein